MGGPEEYAEEDLFEKINGKAPFYTESGFVKLTTQRFSSEGDEDSWMEIYLYDMGGARGAFSVFSLQRREDVELLDEFGFGYKTSNGLYLAVDKYYVEIVGSSESDELSDAMVEVGKGLQAKIGVGGGDINFGSFVEDGLVEGSISLHLDGAFGFAGLGDIFTARYLIDGKKVEAFLSERGSVEEAEAVAKSYYDFLIENGAKQKVADNEVFEGMVLDFYGEMKIVFSVGRFVFGISNAADQKVGEKLVLRFIEKSGEEGAK